uniref:WD repeat-containing protein 44 n=1 Tax=Fagus sylvatica TaxID=28930 RepID=A0A2N9GMC5_FAGSY
MERKRTLTMNWDGLADDDDDDRFFESYNRIPSSVSLDLDVYCSSSDEDEDFDDSRMSFTSAVSSIRSPNFRSFDTTTTSSSSSSPSSVIMSSPDYNIWMSTPGSINERRKRLLQGMGLASDKKQLLSFKRLVSDKVNTNDTVSSPPPPTKEEPKQEQQQQQQDTVTTPRSPSQFPIVLVRSRSDGDIETDSFSIPTKRKEDLIGAISKQRLTRTYSMILAARARICSYLDSIRVSPKEGAGAGSGPGGSMRRSNAFSSMLSSNGRLGAFFLIKNLDTGKEFVVSEYDQNGMWNRLNDLQTGKKLTMEEFEKCVGYSPVVKELMRRENVSRRGDLIERKMSVNSYFSKSLRMSKRGGAALLKNVKGLANSMSGLIGEKERELSQIPSPVLEQKPMKNTSSEWIKVRQSGKSGKELSALHLCQEIQGHEGSIWCIKFSQDGQFLASAGEDRVIHVWEVQECEVMSLKPGEEGSMTPNMTPLHPSLCVSNSLDRPGIGEVTPLPSEKKRRGKSSTKKGNSIPDYVHVPETVFLLLEKPVCSFQGHQDDVLDLSWSKSQLLLSSSMDKTVRLWDMETKTCLKLFAHNDYVTCIQFNPVDDNYFISGSLDAKVRIWSVPDRHVVDWIDFHEMVTAASYTPDGQGAIIGSHKGIIRMYSTKGFRNTSSQIAASFSQDGKYIISASEDSQVYVWKHEEPRNAGTGKNKSVITQSHEHFQCKDVSVAIPWPGTIKGEPPPMPVQSKRHSKRFTSQLPSSAGGSPTKEDNFASSRRQLPPLPKKVANALRESSASVRYGDSPSISAATNPSSSSRSSSWSWFDAGNNHVTNNIQPTAWGLVIVTAGLGGEIRAYQNFGLPRRFGRQTNLFGGPT